MTATAPLVADTAHRYLLRREWPGGTGTVLWVMHNPSTADATTDDPTIRRCTRFSRDWGYHALEVVNCYALRATDPAALRDADAPVGRDNDATIAAAALRADAVVVGFGHSPWRRDVVRAAEVVDILRRWHRGPLLCLGGTAAGWPRHPLFVAASTTPVEWR